MSHRLADGESETREYASSIRLIERKESSRTLMYNRYIAIDGEPRSLPLLADSFSLCKMHIFPYFGTSKRSQRNYNSSESLFNIQILNQVPINRFFKITLIFSTTL